MLRWRLLLGTLLIALLAALCYADVKAHLPGLYLFPFAAICTLLAAQEFLSLAAARGFSLRPWLLYGGSLLMLCANLVPLVARPNPLGPIGWPAAAFAILIVAAFVDEIVTYERGVPVLERLAVGLLGVTYVGWLFTFVVQLRLLSASYVSNTEGFLGEWGMAALASLIAVVKMGDTGAYTVGRLIGKHKMCPQLSPGKTIEGAVGGLIFSCAGAGLTLGWLLPPGGWDQPPVEVWRWIVFGLVVGLAGMFGDLAESLIKRDVGRKDSSTWMPGFGGVLDILDAILLAAPIAWLCWICGLLPG